MNFAHEARTCFAFLETLGFKVNTQPYIQHSWEEQITYDTNGVKLEIFRCLNSQEIGIRFIDKRTSDDESWDIVTYLKLIDRPLAASFGLSIAKDDKEVLELLEKYATALQGPGMEILKGSRTQFATFREALRTGKGLEPLGVPTRFTGR